MIEPFTARCLADIPGLNHGFFTRSGGTSEGIYASLNCGIGSRDERGRVQENRARVAAHLGTTRERLLTLHQVHSADALAVSEPWSIGPGQPLPKADALVTATPGLAVAALAADCAPLLFADPKARIVAAAHAGWKGALGGIIEATIASMTRRGAKARNIRAALGPCIGRDAYEVGPEFEATFLAADPNNQRFFHWPPGGQRPHFDLPGFVLARLAAAGLAEVETCSRCTYAHERELFSFRRSVHRSEPDYGRQISAIVLL